jgi:ketosteroid isomerase-like protein
LLPSTAVQVRAARRGMSLLETVLQFVAAINAHDVDVIVECMAPEHFFVDSLGNRIPGIAMRTGWQQYFKLVPDYWIQIEDEIANGDAVILLGKAGGTYVPADGLLKAENRWETPAAWRAVVDDGKVLEWRVYCDNEPIREKMRAAASH